MRRKILFVALALVAAACGGGTVADAPASHTIQTGATGEQTPIVRPGTTAGQAGPTDPAPAPPADLPDSDYPDVVVADLAGGSVNLRTLALESQPVLLWFWAPH